jgi:hypothetical protein
MQTLEDHLIIHGIDKSYKVWVHHGEKLASNIDDTNEVDFDEFMDAPHVAQMVDDMRDELTDNPGDFESLVADAEQPLYPDCAKFTKLSILVRLFNLKAKYGLSDVFFSELLALLKEMLPENNEIPSSFYSAKKTLGALGLGYEKIHACPNDCILYRKELEHANKCPNCDESRWKKKKNSEEELKGIPAKVLWYIPIIPRFRRLFRNASHSKNLTWHAMERIKDGKMRHPADSPS